MCTICFYSINQTINENNIKFDFIAKIDENYASFTNGCLRFMLSFNLLNESLDTPENSLKVEEFISTRKVFGDMCQFVKQK